MSDTDPAPAALDPAQQQFIDLWLSVEGLSAAPETLKPYCDLLATSVEDFGDPNERSALAVMYSCALSERGVELNAGVRHPIYLAHYQLEHAVSDVIEVHQWANALRPRAYPLKLGFGMVIDAPIHVVGGIVGLDPLPDGTTMVTSIDGGQRDARGFEAILRRKRIYVPGTKDRAPTLGGRPVMHVLDCIALAACESWI